jgi:hypothetical protein|tara:strand:+ start:339 stop:1997 length:1659 start_codon:yes stop_codon:yes gene_type:complete
MLKAINNIKTFSIQYVGLGIIIIFYCLSIKDFLTSSDKNIFLSLSIITDPSYLALLIKKELIILQNGINFSFMPYILDRVFIKIIGFEKFWVLMLFYKSFSFIILFLGIKKLLKTNINNLILISIIIGLIFCIDISPFSDRYPRPQFTNILFFFIFIFNLCLINKISFNSVYFFIYGMAQFLLAITNPWAFIVCTTMSFFSIVKSNDTKKFIIVIIGFSIIAIPSLYYLYLNSGLHNEYLGLKKIYNSYFFLKDYFFSIFFNLELLFVLLLLIFSSFILKRSLEINIFIISLVFAIVPFLIIQKTIQTYHLIDSIRDLLILFSIVHISYLIKLEKFRFLNIYINKFNLKFFSVCLLFIILVILNLGNSWIVRANNIDFTWKKNSKAILYLDNLPSDCKLVSNNLDLVSYWHNIKDNKVIPLDGFIRTSSLNNVQNEIKLAINLLSSIKTLSILEIDGIIKYATHNYYATSKSTHAPSLQFNSISEKNDYLNLRKNISSLDMFPILVPTNIYSSIIDFEKLNIDLAKREKIIVLFSYAENDDNNNFEIKNFCF